MPILATAARNAAVNAIAALLNGGTIRFETSANNEVATCGFSATAFGAAASGTATANAISSDTNADGGTVDHALLRDSSAATIITATCTATGGGGDIELTSLAIGAGDTLAVNSMTLTQPAS